jgi:hypothetical protein
VLLTLHNTEHAWPKGIHDATDIKQLNVAISQAQRLAEAHKTGAN